MSDERTIGKLEARTEALEDDIQEIRADVKSILAIMNQTKGGWKTLVVVGGISGSLGALLMKFLPFTTTLPR